MEWSGVEWLEWVWFGLVGTGIFGLPLALLGLDG